MKKTWRKILSMLLVACMMSGLFTAAATETEQQWVNPFEDVEADAWYYDAVAFVMQNNLMEISGDTFGAGEALTRAELVQAIYTLEGKPAVNVGNNIYGVANDVDVKDATIGNNFYDVADDTSYTMAVIWASKNGIVDGYGNGSFGPDDVVTREQMATILYRYVQYKGEGFEGSWMFLLDYPDRAEVSEWAYEAMCWMTMNGIINGVADGESVMLCPTGTATRAQLATILWRFCEKFANN